jgi:hypothetical protein
MEYIVTTPMHENGLIVTNPLPNLLRKNPFSNSFLEQNMISKAEKL